MMSRRGTVLLLLLLPALLPGAEKDVWSGVERVVAMGDVHGDYKQFTTLLGQAGLIDKDEKWTGGKAHLVQTGDVPDRGPDTRKIMDLLMKLEKEASRAGGAVHALIGNHEAMNVYGDLRYVIPEEYAAFRDSNSERTREMIWEQHLEVLRRNPNAPASPDKAYRQDWESKHPMGFVEHRRNWAPNGKYGQWVRSHNAVVKVNDSLFLHGGISPKFADTMLQQINERVRQELEDFKLLQDGVTMDPDGPLWYRGLATENEATLASHVDTVLRNYGVKRIVIGHTVTPGTVIPRFGGKVVMIDCGMSAAYGGRQAFLVIEKDKLQTVHRGKPLDLAVEGPAMLEYFKAAAALDPQPSPLAALIRALEGGAAAR
ncbi:MAG: metallophosphoesterase [Bryobacteraceae bacterium]